jgi:lipoprotein-anchoring transpeptidase ErfK/SrfK
VSLDVLDLNVTTPAARETDAPRTTTKSTPPLPLPLRAVLMAAPALALLPATDAAAYTVFWPNQTFVYDEPVAPPPRPRRKPSYPRLAEPPKDVAKPKGPLIITVSIEQQKLRVYDADGLVAETPVSTGMRGHSTPMGVFSIIQKSKWHRSNIYSGAPMPYMQRITWSGVALHAGVLPGYPASHGCIRMPMAFATKLWGWSKLGARVIITPGEVSPADISHPLLATRAPTPLAAAPTAPAASVEAKAPDLRPSQVDGGSERVRIADAEGRIAAVSETKADRASDAAPATSPAAAAPEPATDAAPTQSAATAMEPAKETATEASREAAKDQTRMAAETAAAPADKPTAASEKPAVPADKPAATADKPAEAPAPALADTLPPPKRPGHVAVLISRKDGKLSVRQNFEPWFDLPVTFSGPEKPLGTHVFTARPDATNAGSFRWSVVTLPVPRKAEPVPPRGRRAVAAPEPAAVTPPASPAEALDRLALPEEAKIRIASALAAGTSIIVSDQAPSNETGLGTDFIMALR